MKEIKAMRPMIIVAVIAICFDQLTKIIIRRTVAISGPIKVIEGWFNITYAKNTGMAFGMLRGWNPVFIIVVFVAIGFIFVYYRQFKASGWMRISLGLLLGGALGNLIDRIIFGYVTDFLQFRWWFVHLRWWPSFNIADACVVAGAIMVILGMFERSKSVDNGDQSEEIISPSLEDS